MNIKAILVAASALVLSATAVSAQNKDKKDAKCKDAKCEMMNKEQCGAKASCLFDNLNLTDAQKAKIKEMKENNAKARKESKDKAISDRKTARKNELAQIKSILTPEQYVQFLENSYLNAGKQGQRGGKDMKPGDRKGGAFGKGMKRGGDRKGAPAAKSEKK